MAGDAVIACIGAGRMGRGIAQCVAYAGHAVRLIDAKERDAAAFATLRDEALGEIRTALEAIAALGAFDAKAVAPIMQRVSIVPRGEAAAGLSGARIVFEGVPEVMEAKRDAFALFDAHADGDAVLASTTSTMLSTELAGLTVAPERFLNAHWLNPAFLMPLVELSPAAETDAATTAFLREFLEGIGKVPIVCKASPGYIVPRIQALAMNEAARIVEEGVASAEDVDKAVTYGFGLRFGVLGLLEFIDWGGGDILYYASRYLAGAFDDERYAAPEIISRNMEEGRIGLKTGSGFFDYAGVDVDAYRQRRMAAFLKALDHAGLVRPPVL
ncbi:3-hydroxybutyryl-CoA dehydrogenase [Nitratireductor pacificus]|uniref:L-gulonate 3-dehydrogenase n=1 Tax=Nitratireductor pacificus pht-3B TaxID=391937 RepID=K2N1T1_9HYPH|nr:3-hydroxybutyryl-CoA dehydrogenase [Nitratireductor pacificus]EKF18128.1 3-hydroxybutyryl-CoA dehydrogenase [Nitratireductor pacificus pht-3B]